MASLEDLDVISARSDARIEAANTRIEAAINRQIIWTVSTIVAFAAIIIAAMKL